MDSRRDFLKKAVLLGAGSGLAGAWQASIQRAFAIDPPAGSSYLDAEHVVILMQENRSFDHAFGTLQGVRGFNDPRAVELPNGNPVWLQTNAANETCAPFHFNIKDTKITWMGSLPHGRDSQVAARHGGRYDRWLDAKRPDDKAYAHLPLTMGYYNRDDIPFYYALADAFTICDQNFCSSLTGTTPNRLYLWTGTIRAEPSISSPAKLYNEDADHDTMVSWKTFPERLEALGISWRVYQNEIDLPIGFSDEEAAWLSNYGDNPLEYFTQYNARHSPAHRQALAESEKSLVAELKRLESHSSRSPELEKQIATVCGKLEKVARERAVWTPAAFAGLPPLAQNLYHKAFTTNAGASHYRQLASVTCHEGKNKRRMKIPKGDVLHQFREDVGADRLPAVSWLVAPERFSDHPSSPWYGAWYLSEVLNILTRNPAVWKKTIFILCYDENDGYFDHVPPFVPPHPDHPETGKVSDGIDTAVEQSGPDQEKDFRRRHPGVIPDPIGLGYRVPLLIASPWTRGGCVCSQVFDHTSILQFLEKFLSHKTSREVRETNISQWRRTVCGDLTSVFRPYAGEKIPLPAPVERAAFVDSINRAQFRPVPDGFKKLTAEEIAQARGQPGPPPFLPQQEPGIRAACGLPYELVVDGMLSGDRKSFTLSFAAGNKLFGERAAGAPIQAYAPGKVRAASGTFEAGRTWNYAVRAGDRLSDVWLLDDFENGSYHLRTRGPNGFHREFHGDANNPMLEISLTPAPPDGAALSLVNRDPARAMDVLIEDLSYGRSPRQVTLDANANTVVSLELAKSHCWYDFQVTVAGQPSFRNRYSGHVETGRDSFSDPFMGRVKSA
jgi:phospholipase C